MITLDTIDYSLHSIQIKDAAGDALAIGADGSLNVTDNGGSLTVDATNLDIRDLTHVSDSVSIGDGTEIASVTASNQLEVAVTAALPAGTNNIGDVDVLSVVPGTGATNLGKAEDAAHTSGDVGVMALAVRADANGSLVSADGDYAPIQISASGLVKVGIFDSAGDQLVINADGSFNVQTVEAGYSSWTVVDEDVTTTESQLVSTPLTGRLRVEIQNLGSNDIYIREATGVTAANGLKIPKGSSYEQALDAGANIFAIAAAGTSDVRIAQYAA